MATTNKPTGTNATAAPVSITSDKYEDLTTRLSKLVALLEHTHGGSAEAFDSMGEELRGTYLWHCTDVARECHQMAEQFGMQCYAERNAAGKMGCAA